MHNQETKYEIPWIDIDPKGLPSRGLVYPEGVKIKYRTYAFGEVKMSSISTPDIVTTIETVAAGVKTEGIGVKSLTFMDLLYIGTLRKVSTQQNSTYVMPFVCHECEKEGEHKFTESQLEFREIDRSVTKFPLVIEGIRGKHELRFSPITVGGMLDLFKGVYKEAIKGGEPDQTAIIAGAVTNMGFKEAYDLLYSLTDPEDIELIQEADKLMMHDLKPLLAICKNEVESNGSKKVCNTENHIVLQGREALIKPFRTGEQSVRRRISFGVPQPDQCAPN